MNYNSQLQSNNTDLQQVLETLQHKAAGGGSNYTTCTVTLDNDMWGADCQIDYITYMAAEDGTVQNYAKLRKGTDNLTHMVIPNVVCGTTISFITTLYIPDPCVEIDGSAIFESAEPFMHRINEHVFNIKAPSIAGENCTIYYGYNV